jgi:hypothetical protein
VKTISDPPLKKVAYFVTCQEACLKDVERAFGVLQHRFAIVRYSAFTLSESQMWEVMNAYVIMHSMIIESERDSSADDDHPFDFHDHLDEVEHVPVLFAAFLVIKPNPLDVGVHNQL